MMSERKRFEQMANAMGLHLSQEQIDARWREVQARIQQDQLARPEAYQDAPDQTEEYFRAIRESEKPWWMK